MLNKCKFNCNWKEVNKLSNGEPDAVTIKMSPVYDGNEENKKFFKYTPGGELDLYVVNPEFAECIKMGKTYYIDITPAE